MKDTKFSAIFGGIMAAGVLGFGYLAFSSWSSLKNATKEYASTGKAVTALRSSKLFPDDSNLAAKIEKVDAYEASVDALQAKLVASQRALKEVPQQDFPRILLAAYDQTAAAAAAAMVTLPDNFYFGMEVYKNGLPPAAACSMLEWQLDGIRFLTNILIDERIDSLDRITRETLPVESADAGKETAEKGGKTASPPVRRTAGDDVAYEPGRVMETTRFTIDFTADHAAFERVLNRISNEKSFFYWTRSLRVENEKKEGPPKGQPFAPIPVPTDPAADPVAPADPAAADPAAAEELKPLAMIDVREILGTEKVRASLVIDLVRFKGQDGPAGDEAPAPSN